MANLQLASKGYEPPSPGKVCPICDSTNTYYSCHNCSWACMNCDEVFVPITLAGRNSREETVPLPYGELTPSLLGSYNYNTEYTPDWLMILCPNCNSDNVCCLDPLFNPEIENRGRWFCISCHDSWEYGYEK